MSFASGLAEDGFAIATAVLSDADCLELESHLAMVELSGAGSRTLLATQWCEDLANRLRETPVLRSSLSSCVAVQCTYFDKSDTLNWSVPIHQDLAIPVAARIDDPQLRGWSVKEGDLFVQPPPAVLDGLVAIRLHLDDSDSDNGPLRVVPGSHRGGRLPDEAQSALRRDAGEVECVVGRGGVVAMKPLLLHASSKSISSKPRRVLHFVYGPASLPLGLSWARAV
jgi:hypothetical protein